MSIVTSMWSESSYKTSWVSACRYQCIFRAIANKWHLSCKRSNLLHYSITVANHCLLYALASLSSRVVGNLNYSVWTHFYLVWLLRNFVLKGMTFGIRNCKIFLPLMSHWLVARVWGSGFLAIFGQKSPLCASQPRWKGGSLFIQCKAQLKQRGIATNNSHNMAPHQHMSVRYPYKKRRADRTRAFIKKFKAKANGKFQRVIRSLHTTLQMWKEHQESKGQCNLTMGATTQIMY